MFSARTPFLPFSGQTVCARHMGFVPVHTQYMGLHLRNADFFSQLSAKRCYVHLKTIFPIPPCIRHRERNCSIYILKGLSSATNFPPYAFPFSARGRRGGVEYGKGEGNAFWLIVLTFSEFLCAGHWPQYLWGYLRHPKPFFACPFDAAVFREKMKSNFSLSLARTLLGDLFTFTVHIRHPSSQTAAWCLSQLCSSKGELF